jgi:hypothetical protein
MAAIDTITTTITNAPLPQMIEKMGLSIAQAQKALDMNSIAMLAELAESSVTVGDKDTNLLMLGFVPSFYAFTEASFEAKLDFTIAESETFSIGGSVGVEIPVGEEDSSGKRGLFAASVNASYSRKFDQQASGSSSMACRMVSLPPPDRLLQFLKEMNPEVPASTE